MAIENNQTEHLIKMYIIFEVDEDESNILNITVKHLSVNHHPPSRFKLNKTTASTCQSVLWVAAPSIAPLHVLLPTTRISARPYARGLPGPRTSPWRRRELQLRLVRGQSLIIAVPAPIMAAPGRQRSPSGQQHCCTLAKLHVLLIS